ncbi:MAG TPA: PaaI family thioesterase [Caulobacteraceae bacterium]|jgi:uncharacterized protein (TIGR00369 family)|nr:PaaI family thioesterase [Caulobacteraceae bacterium]
MALNPVIEAMVLKSMRNCPQAVAIGMEMVSMDEATATLRAPYKAELVGDPDTGVIAGGVVTTLLDHTCGQAVMAALRAPTPIATLDLRIDYMRAAEPGLDIHAQAHCYKLTHSVAFVRATAYDRDVADPVATAQAVFMITGAAGAPIPDTAPGDAA